MSNKNTIPFQIESRLVHILSSIVQHLVGLIVNVVRWKGEQVDRIWQRHASEYGHIVVIAGTTHGHKQFHPAAGPRH